MTCIGIRLRRAAGAGSGAVLCTAVLCTLVLLSEAAVAQEAAVAPGVQMISAAGEKAILAGPGLVAVGSVSADVTIVEYFDYNCPYCKLVVPTLRTLLAEDPKLAVVYKDWPILGPTSVYAAQSALAAKWQGKYVVAHDALLTGPRLSDNTQVDGELQKSGVNMARLKKDRIAHSPEIEAVLARNAKEARALVLDGTPGILVGRELIGGVTDLNVMKGLVASVRRSQ